MLEKLVSLGYERVEQVEQRGHFSVRGDIVDIFAVNMAEPVRIEFFGDDVDTMRSFSLDTQRSIEHLKSCEILPLFLSGSEEEGSLLSYMRTGVIVFDEPHRLQEQLKAFMRERDEHKEHFFDWRSLVDTVRANTTIHMSFLQHKVPYFSIKETLGISAKSVSSFERQIPLLLDEIDHWHHREYCVAVIIENQQRRELLEKEMQRAGILYSLEHSLVMTSGRVCIMHGLLTDGFELPHGKYIVLSERNIFGQQKKKLRKRAKKGQEIRYFTDLKEGDYVVHTVHGIGKYIGLKTIEADGFYKDYIEIAYAGTDKLFLPADNLDHIEKYIGHEGSSPKLHKIGGRDWQRAKDKAKKSIDDLAEKLTNLYAAREVIDGFAFLPDQPWQEEFESAFPYEETEDQLQAIKEIKASMEKPRPMDRLLCGDVGFGKTEVAMRAMFKAVMSGKQVAMLVPTTILAQQHYQTFLERFSSFGVRVEVLNRFRSAKEKKDILAAVKSGSCDILIGTHALLNKKVEFKELGFLVVDEEQRFGVAQKEKWKDWATDIDVLTLSATPIPRTLHMSLVGVREMSVIHTPPEDRIAVQTYVLEYDLSLVIEAIKQEVQRGGQVYFVYNRVASIYRMAEKLEEAMPDIRMAVAHGQMGGAEIENIMVDFYGGAYDLLLSTSIIENGLDVPNANTIIIYDADKLGLSQLYQMRGRVGRSGRRAYAYFMYQRDKVMTEAAEKRLRAIKEFTELGAGFKLAMRDLEIRGAGNLLGAQQHGNIGSVGFATYCTMLEEAIAKAQNKEVVLPEPDPVIDLKVNAFIDEAYISDNGRKILMYQRMLHIKSSIQLEDFIEELVDRYGKPTESVDMLLRMARLKERARTLGIKSVILRGNIIEIIWAKDECMANWDMGAVLPEYWKRMKFGTIKPTTLRVNRENSNESIINFTENLFTQLEKRYNKG